MTKHTTNEDWLLKSMDKNQVIAADNIKKELGRMNDILNTKGHCSTIDPDRIHKLRTDIYVYIQSVTGSTNPRHIDNTEFSMKLKTIENKLIVGCYAKERELLAKIAEISQKEI